VDNLRKIFGRSWALKKDLNAGTVIEREHLTLKKPGTGIPGSKLYLIIGRKLKNNKSAKRLLTLKDLK
jgi:sialic acid synthase SpsE